MASVTATRSRDSDLHNVELAKGQRAHTTKVPDRGSKGDLAHLQDTMDKQEKLLWATIITLAKNQVMDSEKGGLDSASIMQATSTSSQFKMQKMGLEQSMKAFDMMKEAALATTSQMVGQRVSLDDGVRNYSGAPVKFNYEILGKSIPPGSVIQTQISVMTNEGKEILSKSSRGDKLGKNSFLWTGVDKNGEKVEEGTYRISVSSSYTIPGKSNNAIGLTTTTVKKGTVDEVEVDDDLNLSLIIDGQRFGMESLRGMSRDGKKDLEEAQGPVSEYMGYFGKTVEIEQNKVNFNGANVKVPFISKVADKDVTVKISFLDDEGKLAAYAESVQTITEGQNNFAWSGWDVKSPDEFNKMKDKEIDPAYLPIGAYTYKVSVVTGDVETKLDNIGTYKIDSIDKSSGNVVLGSEGYAFAVRDVKKVVENAPAKTSYNQLLQEGAEFIGKRAIFDTFIAYDGKTNPDIDFSINNPGDTKHLGTAKIKILNAKGETVAEVPAPLLYPNDVEVVPETAPPLNASSQLLVKNFFAKKFPDSDWDNQLQSEKNEVAAYIYNGFRSGELFLNGYDNLLQDDKVVQNLRNMGIVRVQWDGKSTGANPAQLTAGNYTYVVDYEILDAANVVLDTQTIDKSVGRIIATKVDNNGEIILDIDGNLEISLNKVTQITI